MKKNLRIALRHAHNATSLLFEEVATGYDDTALFFSLCLAVTSILIVHFLNAGYAWGMVNALIFVAIRIAVRTRVSATAGLYLAMSYSLCVLFFSVLHFFL